MFVRQNLRAIACLALLFTPALAQEEKEQSKEQAAEPHSLRVTPEAVTLPVGESVQLEAEVLDVGGRPVKAQVFFFSRSRREVQVTREGKVTARRPGEFTVLARAIGSNRRGGPSAEVKVTIPFPKPDKIVFQNAQSELYAGTSVKMPAQVMDASGLEREDLKAAVTSSNPDVAAIDEFGFVTAMAPGKTVLTAKGSGLQTTHELTVLKNPVASIVLSAEETSVRTGDVVRFTATLKDADGNTVEGVPIQYSFQAAPDDNLGPGASGQIEQDGRFVAETPGLYTIVASCGTAAARKAIKACKRFEQEQEITIIGRGKVHDTHTSDLWVWEGADGRDYAVTGTWGANGDAHFWDVTDPTQIERIATVSVDARTVNDVKVSPNGKLCVISREGASNRKNGIVIYDVTDPRKPKVLSEYNEELTGGVHNVFVEDDHIYSLSAGRRYDILSIEDPSQPKKVGSYQIFEPGASIHDVWVEDGIAYSSNWRYGVHLVDVGYGIEGGSPSNPKKIASYAYPSGRNHAAFPYRSPHTGKFYVIAGDESFPFGLSVKDKPTYPRGWMHFIDFSDLKNPKEVARYQVPEAGTHNLWVENDILYAAYYNGGLRLVDISGDLMGDLYRQGREIAWYLPTDKDGVVPNAPMVWGPQPHKGTIFFSDWNTGLWAAKLVPKRGRR